MEQCSNYTTAQGVCKLSIQLYFAFSPEEAAAASRSGHPTACLGYRLAADAPALLAPQTEVPAGCRMVLQDSTLPSYPPTMALARLIAQYASSCHSGILCDFDRSPALFWQEFLPMLETACGDAGLPLWVPAAYGSCAPRCPVILPSDCVEGTFIRHLERSATANPQGCVLELRPLACRIALPCLTEPQRLSRTDAEEQIARCSSVGFSEPLCCHWGLLSSDPVTVLLWDDRISLSRKLDAAQRAGFLAAVGLLQELGGDFPSK